MSGTADAAFVFAGDAGPGQFFPDDHFLEYLRAWVETTTETTTYLSTVDRPADDGADPPFCVVHAFGPSGKLERAISGQATALSFYLQVNGVGRGYRDALWMLDRAVSAVRTMPPPDYVNDILVHGRSSAFETDSEALRAVAQRLAVMVTLA